MFTDDLAIQGPEYPGAVLGAIKRAAEAVPAGYLKAGYAYATAGGVLLATGALEDALPGWARMKKQWLISLDWGTTDPKAIELLMALPNSSVRIPNAAEVIKRRLSPQVCFHPKIMVLHDRRTSEMDAAALVLGSGNLTAAGLRSGYEATSLTVVTHPSKSKSDRKSLETMAQCLADLDRIWRKSEAPDAALISRYRELRKRRPAVAEDMTLESRELEKAEVEQTFDRIATLKTATHLWVDAGYVLQNRGGDRPGNQVDLPRGTRTFFGFSGKKIPRNTMLGQVRIKYGAHVSTTHMRFANNSMDRLNLPIPGEAGPPSYDDAWLLFERLGDETFRLAVLDTRQLRAAKRRSSEQGSLFEMRGGRQYGVYKA